MQDASELYRPIIISITKQVLTIYSVSEAVEATNLLAADITKLARKIVSES